MLTEDADKKQEKHIYSAFQNFIHLVKVNGGSCIRGDLQKKVATIDFLSCWNSKMHIVISYDGNHVWIISACVDENDENDDTEFLTSGFLASNDVFQMQTKFFHVETKTVQFWSFLKKEYPLWNLVKKWNRCVYSFEIKTSMNIFVCIGLNARLATMEWIKVSIEGFYGSCLTHVQKKPQITELELTNLLKIAMKLSEDESQLMNETGGAKIKN